MKRNELKMWAARFVTIGLMTLVAACGQTQPPNNGQCPGPACPGGPGGIPQGQVACMPIQPGAQMPFTATGISMNSINLQFGRLPNGQTIGQVAMGGAVVNGMGGMQYTGGSNATGSTISITLQNSNGAVMPQTGYPTGGYYPTYPTYPQTGTTAGVANRLTGFIQISQYELQLAGLMNQNYMMPGAYNQYPQYGYPQYPQQQYPGGTVPGATGQACVSSVGATGALNNAYAKFYGGASDYVYVYINNGQSYLRFKI